MGCHGYQLYAMPFLLAVDQETITILLSDNKAKSLKYRSVNYVPHGESDEENSCKVRTISRRIAAGGPKLFREVPIGDIDVVRRGLGDGRNYLAAPRRAP